MPERRTRRKPRRHEQFASKKEAILNAAADLIVENGFENVSLADIARRLNVSKPTLYYYVESKDQLLFELHEIGFAAVKTALDAAQDSDRTGLERLEIFLRHYAEGGFTNFGRALVETGIRGLSPENEKRMRTRQRAADRMLENIIRDGVADGSIDAQTDPAIAASYLFGALNWIAYAPGDWSNLSPRKTARDYVAVICAGLLPRA
ncbi:MAG: TetR/AcrR family transcriptional regulator [Hyphomonadaceae bacterium]|nr:TetR/AcrR family transcriptional regulator [Hyphomonadaceae bacterium]